MNDPFATLPGTLEAVWQRLARGVADRRAPARHPVLATVGEGGEARIVVLRGADRAAAVLRVHTDLRSGKVAQLRAKPRATLLVWDPRARLQIRLRVRVAVLTGAAVRPEWDRVPEAARGVYGSLPAPGVVLGDPADAVPGPDPAAFAVLECRILAIETLHLGEDRHARALFDSAGSVWLAP